MPLIDQAIENKARLIELKADMKPDDALLAMTSELSRVTGDLLLAVQIAETALTLAEHAGIADVPIARLREMLDKLTNEKEESDNE